VAAAVGEGGRFLPGCCQGAATRSRFFEEKAGSNAAWGAKGQGLAPQELSSRGANISRIPALPGACFGQYEIDRLTMAF
jgi:hypothetical protein